MSNKNYWLTIAGTVMMLYALNLSFWGGMLFLIGLFFVQEGDRQ